MAADLATLRGALASHHAAMAAETNRREAELAALRRRSKGFAAAEPLASQLGRLSSFPKLAANLRAPTSTLEEQISASHALAEAVSGVVRHLDDTQLRVQQALALVEDVANLKTCVRQAKTCLDAGDLDAAAGMAKKFKTMGASGSRLSVLEEIAPEDYSAMEYAIRRTQREVEGALEKLTVDGADGEKHQDVLRLSLLLGSLGKAKEGLDKYLHFIEKVIDRDFGPEAEYRPTPGEEATFNPTPLLTRVFNSSASLLIRSLRSVTESFESERGGLAFLQLVEAKVERRAVLVVRGFLRGRDLSNRAAAALGPGSLSTAPSTPSAGPTPLELQQRTLTMALLNEAALVLQHAERYDRFLRASYKGEAEQAAKADLEASAPVTRRSALAEAVAELAANYSSVEFQVVQGGMHKALRTDEHTAVANPDAAGPPRPYPSVEQCFFAIKQSVRRALATGNAGAASATINHACNALTMTLLPAYDGLVRRIAPPPPQLVVEMARGGGVGGSAALQAQLAARLQRGLNTMTTATMTFGDTLSFGLGNLGLGSDAGQSQAQKPLSGDRRKEEIDDPIRHNLRVLNTLLMGEAYMKQLQRDCKARMLDTFEAGTGANQLKAVIENMGTVGGTFGDSLGAGLDTVVGSLKSALKQIITAGIGAASTGAEEAGREAGPTYLMSERDFNDAAANPHPWVYRSIAALQVLLQPYRAAVLYETWAQLLQRLCAFFAKAIEGAVMRHGFTLWGGLQLDKELRMIILFFKHLIEAGEDDAQSSAGTGEDVDGDRLVKVAFQRLQQLSQLLNVSEVAEALDYYDGTSVSSSRRSHLTAAEVRQVLALRKDFDPEEIRQLRLS